MKVITHCNNTILKSTELCLHFPDIFMIWFKAQQLYWRQRKTHLHSWRLLIKPSCAKKSLLLLQAVSNSLKEQWPMNVPHCTVVRFSEATPSVFISNFVTYATVLQSAHRVPLAAYSYIQYTPFGTASRHQCSGSRNILNSRNTKHYTSFLCLFLLYSSLLPFSPPSTLPSNSPIFPYLFPTPSSHQVTIRFSAWLHIPPTPDTRISSSKW